MIKLGTVVVLGTLEEAWKKLETPIKKIFDLFGDLSEKVDGPLKSALTWLKDTALGALQAGFEGISNAIQAATTFMENLIAAIQRFVPPEIITPGSPTPFEIGFVGIGDAIKAATADIKQMQNTLSVGSFGTPSQGILSPIIPAQQPITNNAGDVITYSNNNNYNLTTQSTFSTASLRNQFAVMEVLGA